MNEDKYRKYFSKKEVINFYAQQNYLYLPEIRFLSSLIKKKQSVKMLDIGVGTGRTTLYFAPCVNEYIGVDYSEAMVSFCKNKFRDYPDNIRFEKADARDLSRFSSASFDVVMFSFNGIDSLEHEDRLMAIAEMKRVCKKDGIVFFSTHNMNVARSYNYTFRMNWRPVRFLRELIRWVLIRKNNSIKKKDFLELPYSLIYDGVVGEARNYYIKPMIQIEQLKQSGFKNVRVYTLNSGLELVENDSIKKTMDGWLYYECEQ